MARGPITLRVIWPIIGEVDDLDLSDAGVVRAMECGRLAKSPITMVSILTDNVTLALSDDGFWRLIG